MAITALQSAATGMRAMDTQLDVIAHNLANSNTHGFKSSRVNFEDLFYEERRQPGALNSLGQRTSTGLFVGLGTRVSNTQLNLQTGSLENTGRPLDVAIMGEGFFKVRTFDGIGGGEAYTRSGNLMIDSEGNLILGTADGPLLEPQINFPAGTDQSSITIMGDGRITAQVDGETQDIGQLELFKFQNPNGLRCEGSNLYTETEASGAVISDMPGNQGFGTLTQNFLEASNVDAVKELTNMIRTQRNFELNSQSIKAADENMQIISRLRS
jgi:flagellar basal-body rod protein FlgG